MNSLSDTIDQLFRENDWPSAIDLLNGNSQRVADDDSLSWCLGWAYLKIEDPSSAEPHFRHAHHLCPERGSYVACLGIALSDLERYPEAEGFLETAVRKSPRSFLARQALAVARMKLGKQEEAVELLEDGISIDAQDPERWAAMADLLSDLGDDRNADIWYAVQDSKDALQLLSNKYDKP